MFTKKALFSGGRVCFKIQAGLKPLMCSSEMLFTFCIIFCGPLGNSLPLPCLFWAAGSDVIDKCLLDNFTEAVTIKNKTFFLVVLFNVKTRKDLGLSALHFSRFPQAQRETCKSNT